MIDKVLGEALGNRSEALIREYMESRDYSRIVEVLTNDSYRNIRNELEKNRNEMRNLEEGFENIGYEREKDYKPEQDLKTVCLRVPAAIRSDENRLIYGGVMIIPRIKTIETRDPEHARIMNRGFGNLQSTTSLSSVDIARMRATQGVNGSVSGTNNPSYRERVAAADRTRETERAREAARVKLERDNQAKREAEQKANAKNQYSYNANSSSTRSNSSSSSSNNNNNATKDRALRSEAIKQEEARRRQAEIERAERKAKRRLRREDGYNTPSSDEETGGFARLDDRAKARASGIDMSGQIKTERKRKLYPELYIGKMKEVDKSQEEFYSPYKNMALGRYYNEHNIDDNEYLEAMKNGKVRYEPNEGKHKSIQQGRIGAEPKNAAEMLKRSFKYKASGNKRVAYDEENNELIVFSRTESRDGMIFHSHVRPWTSYVEKKGDRVEGFDEKMQNILKKLDLVDKNGEKKENTRRR